MSTSGLSLGRGVELSPGRHWDAGVDSFHPLHGTSVAIALHQETREFGDVSADGDITVIPGSPSVCVYGALTRAHYPTGWTQTWV